MNDLFTINPPGRFARALAAATMVLGLVALVGLGARSGMSIQDKDTAIGAAGGAVLTGGRPVGISGGAVVGRIIGHEDRQIRRMANERSAPHGGTPPGGHFASSGRY